MLHAHPHSFEEEAQFIRRRTLIDLEDPGERLVDATLRSRRAGTRRFAFRDSLVGLGEGLCDVLISWGVPDSAILTDDTPVPGRFVEKKHWGFAGRASDGRNLVLVEFTRVGTRRTGLTSGPVVLHKWLGMLYDLSSGPRPAFTGLVAGRPDGRRHPAKSIAGYERHRRRQISHFARTCRQNGLLDAFAYMDLEALSAPEPPDLSLAPSLATLYANLSRESPGSWPAPIFEPAPPRLRIRPA